MLLRTRLFGIAVRFTVVDGSVSDVDAVGCEMASGGVTLRGFYILFSCTATLDWLVRSSHRAATLILDREGRRFHLLLYLDVPWFRLRFAAHAEDRSAGGVNKLPAAPPFRLC